jgi:hypothetical protein
MVGGGGVGRSIDRPTRLAAPDLQSETTEQDVKVGSLVLIARAVSLFSNLQMVLVTHNQSCQCHCLGVNTLSCMDLLDHRSTSVSL